MNELNDLVVLVSIAGIKIAFLYLLTQVTMQILEVKDYIYRQLIGQMLDNMCVMLVLIYQVGAKCLYMPIYMYKSSFIVKSTIKLETMKHSQECDFVFNTCFVISLK